MVKIDFENSNTKFCLIYTLAELVRLNKHELHDRTISFHKDHLDVMFTNVYFDFEENGDRIFILENKNKDKIITKKRENRTRIFQYVYNEEDIPPIEFELSEYDIIIGNLITCIESILNDLSDKKEIKFVKEY